MKQRLALVVAAAALAAAGVAGGWHWGHSQGTPKAGWAWGDAAVSEEGNVSQADTSDGPAAAYDGWAW